MGRPSPFPYCHWAQSSRIPKDCLGAPGKLPHPFQALGVQGGVVSAEGLRSPVPAQPHLPPGLGLPIWKVGPRVCSNFLMRLSGGPDS